MSLKLLTMFRSRQNQQQCQRQQQLPPTWLLIFVICTLLQPLCTHSTPIQTNARTEAEAKRQDRGRCAHDSIAKLIKTSPVILKALGAHIFTDYDFNDPALPLTHSTDELNHSYRGQNEIFATTLDAATMTTMTTSSSSTYSTATANNVEGNNTPMLLTMPTTSPEMGSILITLTPETIYKGASLLKMSPGSENAAHSNSFANANAAESATTFESQLNATLQPAHCFEGNLLKLLPTKLIIFGKLVTKQQEQQQFLRPQDPQKQFSLPHSIKWQEDILHISINGFHRWSPKFENYIWKHLGWDDWSDFTLCSVTCGKGVQQRFRRCLLDNPMVNLNMNANLNVVNVDSVGVDEDDDDDDDITSDDDDDILDGAGRRRGAGDNTDMIDDDVATFDHTSYNENMKRNQAENMRIGGRTLPTVTCTETVELTSYNENVLAAHEVKRKSLSDTPSSPTTSANMSSRTTVVDELRALRTQGDNEHMQAANIVNSPNDVDASVMRTVDIKGTHNEMDKRTRKLNKKRKTTKKFETMSCEGYNIEQRDCNMFECSDDINDFLKFYKRTQFSEDVLQTSASTTQTIDAANDRSVVATVSIADTNDHLSDVDIDEPLGLNDIALANSTPPATPENMGYIRGWRNSLNFTILITLRVKNDSKITATIFSIRNTTHNLYLDQCQDGLRLYLERDNSTEMLPVKFNLYDYRWHQVAISVQNGDFISIFVDCSWTNSYVVSKRLFTLPLDADAEIGRGFSGELQQLLLLPDNQERHQCSNRRTSINEVKRYIIDTFIGDYGN